MTCVLKMCAASKQPALWDISVGVSQPPLSGCLSPDEIHPLMTLRVLGLENSDAAVIKPQFFFYPPGEELVALYTSDHSFFGPLPLDLYLSH